MMIFNLLFIAYSNLLFSDVPLSKYVIKMNFNDRVIGGYDGRYNGSSDYDSELISKIKKNNYQIVILKYLENPDISLFDKMKILETSGVEELEDKIAPNIKAGGLFNDWDFDF